MIAVTGGEMFPITSRDLLSGRNPGCANRTDEVAAAEAITGDTAYGAARLLEWFWDQGMWENMKE